MLAVVGAALTIVSCTPDNGDDVGPTTQVLNVEEIPEDSDYLRLSADGGEFSLLYTIENPNLTGTLGVTTEADWLQVSEIGQFGVAFSYAANNEAPGSAPREAVIKFTYADLDPVYRTVKQLSKEPSFTINWSEVTCGSATYTCEPVDSNMLYLLVSSQDLGQYGVQGTTPEELMNNYLTLLAQNAMLYNQPDNWFVYKGSTAEYPKQAMRFDAETSVTVYAVGFTPVEIMEEVYVTKADLATAVHVWDVPFLPYPTLTIAESDLNKTVSSAAGEVVIDCVLENPLEGTEFLFENAPAWVTPSWADNKLTLTYQANTDAVARRAKIAVSYGYYTNPVEVTLIQEKDSAATAVTLNITVKGTQFNGILVDVVPSDNEVYYALNYKAPEKNWETGEEVAINWMDVTDNLLSYVGAETFHKGAIENYLIKTNVANYDYTGVDFYVYAVPVDATSEQVTDYYGKEKTKWTVNKILGEVAVTDKVTIDISKMPSLKWNDSQLTYNDVQGRYEIKGMPGQKITLKYSVENAVDGCVVVLNGTSFSDSNNVISELVPVIDQEAQTASFTIGQYDISKSYHYCNFTLKYTNADGDNWSIQTENLRVDHDEAAAAEVKALPFEETFASSIGTFLMDDVKIPEGSTYVWKYDSYGYMKASAFVGGSAKASESYLVSPIIDLTSATAPQLSFDHTHKYAGTPSEELTLWVRAEKAKWAKVEIPTYGNNTSWTWANNVIDLSAYAGKKIQIGFKYKSTTEAAATWEIKNVAVADNGGAAVAPLL